MFRRGSDTSVSVAGRLPLSALKNRLLPSPSPLLSALFAAVITAMISTCSSPVTPLPSLPPDAVIVAFGDSITFGTGASPAESYPSVMTGMVARIVVNAGVPGEITREGLRRLPGVLDARKPALLILIHGGNDLLRQIDPQETAGNLRAMVKLARERGIPVVLGGVPAPDLSLSPPAFYRQVAAEAGIPYEGTALPKILGRSSLKSDLIHPNAAGYRKLAEALVKLLRDHGAVEKP